MEKSEEGRSLPPGLNPPPPSQCGNLTPSVGLRSATLSKFNQTLGLKSKGDGHQARRNIKGACLIAAKSERGTAKSGDIRGFLVDGRVKCSKDKYKVQPSFSTEEARSGSWS